MKNQLPKCWRLALASEFKQEYFKDLEKFVTEEYNSIICYPKKEEIFSAFQHCHFDDVKVVVIGQDPYHVENQANGLCFSVHNGVPFPPSLINIFKELSSDLNQPYPTNGDLSRWAKQGVLLLNSILTVRESEAGSHQKKGWENFTDAVIKSISEKKENVVFLLWGGYAKKKGRKIDKKKHYILESGHPSPLSANRGYWFENKHFSKTNDFLKSKNLKPIEW